MKAIYLASMMWSESNEPLCVGKNKKNVKKQALNMLKKTYGNKPVDRGSAMCSCKITSSDIKVQEIILV